MMRYLVQETLGYMVIISGSGWWYQDGNKRPLQQARAALGLTGEATPGNLFFGRNFSQRTSFLWHHLLGRI
jgi:hypothetical protein